MFSLDGKVAVITGGGSGIGLATVCRFAAAGASVVIGDATDQEALANEVDGAFFETDVSDEAAVEALMVGAVGRFGSLDIVVNQAAATSHGIDGGVEGLADDAYMGLFESGVMGVAHGIKHAVRLMPRGGSIVNLTSLAGVTGFPGYPAHGAAAAAVIGLTRSAALRLAPKCIRVNAVCLGFVDGLETKSDSLEEEAFSRVAVPLGRLAAPEDVAAAVHFLACDDSGFITGQAINVGGGLSAGVSAGMLDAIDGVD